MSISWAVLPSDGVIETTASPKDFVFTHLRREEQGRRISRGLTFGYIRPGTLALYPAPVPAARPPFSNLLRRNACRFGCQAVSDSTL